MTNKFNSKNASTDDNFRIIYESVNDVLTHLASLDGSNPPAKEAGVSHVFLRVASEDPDLDPDNPRFDPDNPESAQKGSAGEYVHETVSRPEDFPFSEPDEDEASPDNEGLTPEHEEALRQQAAFDYLETANSDSDVDGDSSIYEVCKTCRGDSRYNQPGNEFYFENHCPGCNNNRTCGDGEFRINNSQHCSGCANHTDCPGKTKAEVPDCSDCNNTGVVPFGYDYDSKQISSNSDTTQPENQEESRIIKNPEKVEELPESSVKENPGANFFDDVVNETKPIATPSPKKPKATTTNSKSGLSFTEAQKLHEQLKQNEQIRQTVAGETPKDEEIHKNCGCSERGGDMTDDQFRMVMRSEEGRRAIQEVRDRYRNGAIEEDYANMLTEPDVLIQQRKKTNVMDRQEAIAQKMIELKKCRGDKAMKELEESAK
jgi:hypothetical protein